MKLLSPLLCISLGSICVFYGWRGKSVLQEGGRAEGLERTATVGGGLLLIAVGLVLGRLVFRLLAGR